MPGGGMPSSREWWVIGLGIVFIIVGLRFLPDAFTSMINAVGVAIWIATGVGIIAARKWIAKYVRE
jgi:multidrug transporter EmrE-like cation transporter